MIKKIDHLVITTRNIDKCLKFYKKIGFSVVSTNERYELFAGDFKINIHILGNELSPHAKNVQTGSADLCFEIDENIEEIKTKLEDDNIIIELGVVSRTGCKGKMKSIYFRDPDDNLLEICSYE